MPNIASKSRPLIEKLRETIYYYAKDVSLLRILFFSIFESVNPPVLYRAHYFWFYFFLAGFAVIALLDLAHEISAWRNGIKKFEWSTLLYKSLSCVSLIIAPILFFVFNAEMIFVIPIVAIGLEVIFRVANFIYYKWWIQSPSEHALEKLASAHLLTPQEWLANQITKCPELKDSINVYELSQSHRALLISRATNELAMENISEAIYAGMMAVGIVMVYILGLSTGAIFFAMPVTLLLCSTIWNVIKKVKSLFPSDPMPESAVISESAHKDIDNNSNLIHGSTAGMLRMTGVTETNKFTLDSMNCAMATSSTNSSSSSSQPTVLSNKRDIQHNIPDQESPLVTMLSRPRSLTS